MESYGLKNNVIFLVLFFSKLRNADYTGSAAKWFSQKKIVNA